MKNDNDNYGFTLVELIIALLISSLAMAAIYNVFRSQQRTYTAQDQVVKMHQNLLAGQRFFIRELMQTGYNDPATNANARLIAYTSVPVMIEFSADLNDDGDTADPGEHLQYRLFPDGDGDQNLGRDDLNNGQAIQTIATKIEQMELLYISRNLSDPMSEGVKSLNPAVLNDVRGVQVSLLARATEPDPDFNQAVTYTSASGAVWAYPADNFRRRLSITTVNFRNAGL